MLLFLNQWDFYCLIFFFSVLQRLLKHSKPGQVYTVDCDVVNTGIPYSDAFTVKSVYCLTKVSKKECRLRISGCVKYKKTVWGIVKCKYF